MEIEVEVSRDIIVTRGNRSIERRKGLLLGKTGMGCPTSPEKDRLKKGIEVNLLII